MTRIETALQRMRDEAQVMVWTGDLTKMAATPTGAALSAFAEAAEAWRGGVKDAREAKDIALRLDAAVDAFRAATEPQP